MSERYVRRGQDGYEYRGREDAVNLVVDGTVFTGWESIQLTRSMDQAVQAFTLTTTNIPGLEAVNSTLRGRAVTVRYGGEVLITGTVDAYECSYAADSHTLTVSGRSLTKALVDCSAMPQWEDNYLTQFRDTTVKDIVEALVKPFGVRVRYEGEIAVAESERVVPLFELDVGVTVFEAISSLLEDRFLYISDSPDGALVLASTAERQSRNRLVCKPSKQQVNVLSAAARWDESASFSRVIVLAQNQGTDDDYGLPVAQVIGQADDSDVRGFRPRIVKASVAMNKQQAESAAAKEMAASLASKFSYQVTVQGWRGDTGNSKELGDVWFENRLVNVDDELAGVSATLLILSVDYSIGEAGTTCALTLVDPRSRERPVNYQVPEQQQDGGGTTLAQPPAPKDETSQAES